MASAVRGPVLHVAFDAQCELTTGSGVRGQAYKQVGLVLDAATGLCVAAGPVEGRIVSFPASAVLKVHTKFVGSGKLTFEVATGGKQVTKQLLVSRATPEALKGILSTLDEAVKRARARNQKQLSQDECVALLRTRYPDQIKKQLAALQAAAGNDMPQPLKGHTRLMLVVDGAGASVAQAGKALLKAFESELQLTSHMRPGESNAQSFKAVCKDRADKSTQIEMRVRTCIHHRWANPLWIDLDLGEKPSVPRVRELVVGQMAGGDEANALVTQLAHGAIKERLAAGLVLHLRSGTLEHGTEFGTRAELRWNEHDPSTAPLGKAELRFWEVSCAGALALPRRTKQPCAVAAPRRLARAAHRSAPPPPLPPPPPPAPPPPLPLPPPLPSAGTAPHRTAPHRTAPHRAAPRRTAPHRAAPHRTAPHRTAPHRTAPHGQRALIAPASYL